VKFLILASIVSFAIAVAGPAQDPAATAAVTIRGRVVDAENGGVLRRARIALVAGDRQLDSVFTDDDGRFAATAAAAAPATPSTLRINKAGYAQVVVPLASDADSGDLQFALVRSAAVTGRVLDAYGTPVSNAYVTGRLFSPDTYRTTAASRQFYTTTDQRGEYRLGGLPPGRYEIRGVRIPPELMAPGMRVEERLFGPTAPLEIAGGGTAMTLASGAEARNVDFRLAGAREVCATGPSVRPAEGAIAGAIAGRVTGASGEPLVCAMVRIVSPDAPVPQVYTDRQGRYLFDGLPAAGTFIVEARTTGYVALRYGQRHPSDREVPIALRDGQRLTGADIVLPRESVVTGTVFDEHGEPLEGISVWAFQVRRVAGRTMTSSTAIARPTDDRGQYRLIGMSPGTYVVGTLSRGVVGGAAGARAYASTYHPGTRDGAIARPISVDVGRDADSVDIVLTPTPTATVSGLALDAAGRPFSGNVSLTVSGRSGAMSLDSWAATPDATGSFSIRHVPPGDYVLKAFGPPDGPPQFGMQYVAVLDGDPPPARVVVTPGATVEGRVVLEVSPDANLAGLAVSVASADFDYSRSVGAARTAMYARGDDGTFRVPGVTGPGRIVIAETPACETCYLKSALVNGFDAADAPFDFGLGGAVYRDVEVVVSDSGATIAGRVAETNGPPVTSYAVVVLPANRDWWYPQSRRLKVGRATADGSFRVAGLPPGEYVVAAVNRFDGGAIAGELNDQDVLDDLFARGERVTVAEGDRRTLDLRLLRR
jgi:protocatechuate 3,4-dioxygenase beta subunit